MNAGQAMRAAQGDPAQGQAHDASRGMQNLQEVLQKMEANAKLLTGDGRTTLQVRLKPARLGTLFVQIERRDGGYEVRLRASNDQGTRAIERQLPVIREQLAQQGIQVERFEVQQPAAERQEGDSQRQMMQEQRQQQEQARDRSARPGDRDRSGGKRFGWRTSEDGTPEGATPEDRPGRLSLGTNTMEVTY
jgi:flagellar hook-length control protein FliK